VRLPMPPVACFVDGLVVAVERGTPLGDVLRAQAVDAREQYKRDLIEAGGRCEALMLQPAVLPMPYGCPDPWWLARVVAARWCP